MANHIRAAFSAIILAGVLGAVSVAPASAMTKKECEDAWHQAKAAGQNPGTFKTYHAANCTGAAPAAAAPAAEPATAPAAQPAAPAPAAQPAPAPAPQPAPAPAPAPAKPAPAAAKPAPKAAAQPTGAGQFANEADAKSHCPSDTVVWVNTKTHIFHYAGHPKYGKTKQGAYMCEADATAGGDRASKSEKAPQ